MVEDNSLTKMLIYIADDDEINLRLIKTVLALNGYTNIRSDNSGKQMLSDIHHNCPDLLLLDIMMPGFSGYEVLEYIKRDDALEHIPVIMITAAPLDESLEPLKHSFELGAMDFISKPFNNMELCLRVRSALRLEYIRQQLETAAARISSLEKLLPICSYCKKVRSDKNYWQEVEVYISEHTDTIFSHSICPDCYNTHVKPQLDSLKNSD